jgi:hypothetical protein
LNTHQIARDIHYQRQREIERRLRLRLNRRAPTPRRYLRHRVGHGLIQIGSMLAADGPLQLSAPDGPAPAGPPQETQP